MITLIHLHLHRHYRATQSLYAVEGDAMFGTPIQKYEREDVWREGDAMFGI